MRYRFRRDRQRLDRKVAFQAGPAAANEFNENVGDWSDLFITRCALTPAPGTEKYANRENIASAPVLIEVRPEQRTLALTAGNRAIVWLAGRDLDAVTYDIAAPPSQPERGANIVIAAVFNDGA